MKLGGGALALALLAGCAATPPPTRSTAAFDPIAFFTGETSGEGEIVPIVGRRQPLQVHSRGERSGDTLIVRQLIREGDKPPRERQWILPAGSIAETRLSDAVGLVRVELAGPRARIRYRTRGGLDIDQHLALQLDSRTLLNRMTVRKWGIAVARVTETIRRPLPLVTEPVSR